MARHNMQGLNDQKQQEKEDAREQEEVSFIERLQSLRNKLKLGPHHKMERFTVMLGATLSFLLLFSIISFVSYRADVAHIASAQSVYTENFNFSLSNEKVHVQGVYGNTDKTDVMVLFRIQNPEAMSADAGNYELFITGKEKSLSYEPEMSFSLFGSTGYGIIRFQHEESLLNEVVDITIRANATLSVQDGSNSSDEVTDGSFSTHDQGRFYINPGADDVEVLDWLDVGETDPVALYTALVAERTDQAIREEIQTHTDELGKLLNRDKEYANRLVSAGYEPPETPRLVDGDYVNDEGVLVAAHDVAGAFDIDYATTTIRDGYINQVMDDLSAFDSFMKKHKENAEEVKRDPSKEEQVRRVGEIQNEDGAVLDLNEVTTGTSPSAQVTAKDSVESLQSTWRTYIKTKTTIQRDLMRDLLVLDADVQSQASSYSVQTGEDVVTFY